MKKKSPKIDSRKVLKERDYKKKMQRVYTLTPGDLRFLLIGAGINKERIEMAHVIRKGHEWLDVVVDDPDGGWVGVCFETYEETGAENETRKMNSAYNLEFWSDLLYFTIAVFLLSLILNRVFGG